MNKYISPLSGTLVLRRLFVSPSTWEMTGTKVEDVPSFLISFFSILPSCFFFLSYFIFFVRLLLLSLCQIFHPIKNTIHSIISLALVVSSIIFLSSFQLIVTFQQHLSYFISFGWVIHSSVIVERNRRENSNNNNKSPDSSSHSNQ